VNTHEKHDLDVDHAGEGPGDAAPVGGAEVGSAQGEARQGHPAPPQEATGRETRLLLLAVRVGFAILFVVVTALAILNTTGQASETLGGVVSRNAPQVLLLSLIVAAVVIGFDVVTRRRRISTLGSLFVGLLFAVLATALMNAVVDLLFQIYDIQNPSLLASAKVVIGIAITYICIATVLQTKDDFRLVIPYVEFAKQIRGARPVLLDTSILIDARIVDAAGTGVFQAPLIVPRFVIGELQALADSSDKMKRAKGRRGLSVVTRLQRVPGLDVSIDETPVPGKAVDQMLVELAQRMPATIMTTDVGLARVATIQRVAVLNLNDLASSLKAPVAAGERVAIRIVKAGEQAGQGIGYLEDGTMVVVEGGAERIGEEVAIVVGTSLQTAAGRLVFAKVAEGSAARGEADAAGGGDAAGERGGEAGRDGDGVPALPKAQRLSLPAEEPSVAPPEAETRRPGPGPLGPGGRGRPTSRNPRR